jgi:hypothetical protein
LERRCPVDLLPDRTSQTLQAWLREHPGVQIISRDRAGAYAEAADKAAPDAVQIADRWHLMRNATDALEDGPQARAPGAQRSRYTGTPAHDTGAFAASAWLQPESQGSQSRAPYRPLGTQDGPHPGCGGPGKLGLSLPFGGGPGTGYLPNRLLPMAESEHLCGTQTPAKTRSPRRPVCRLSSAAMEPRLPQRHDAL